MNAQVAKTLVNRNGRGMNKMNMQVELSVFPIMPDSDSLGEGKQISMCILSA